MKPVFLIFLADDISINFRLKNEYFGVLFDAKIRKISETNYKKNEKSFQQFH
jgi:hypothetical protein